MNNRYKVVDVERRLRGSSMNVLYIVEDITTYENFSCYIEDNLDGTHRYIRYLDEDGNIFDLVHALVEYDNTIYEILDGEVISTRIEEMHENSHNKSNYKNEAEYLKVYNKEEEGIAMRKMKKRVIAL